MDERSSTCCFTGHRPSKLPWGTDESDPRCIRTKKKLQDVLETAYEEGMRHFICGMARGCDLYFAEAVLALRERHTEVTLEAAIPCPSQCQSWPAEEQARWKRLVGAADYRTLIQPSYTKACMHRRNRYMVDHSALLVTIFDGSSGGTQATIAYAMKQKIPFIDIQVEK